MLFMHVKINEKKTINHYFFHLPKNNDYLWIPKPFSPNCSWQNNQLLFVDFKLFSVNYNDYFVDSKPFFGGEEGEEEGVINFYYLVKVLLVRVAT